MPTLLAICGPMFSGKTTALIAHLAQHPGALAIKPAIDLRYAAAEIVSHTGQRIPAHAVSIAAEIEPLARDAAVIGIDEVHFFGRDLTPICRRLLLVGKSVVLAGLERDHHGEPFEPFPTLLCEADEVVKLNSPCAVCGRPAIHSQRMVQTPGRIVIGGAESYQPRCRECFQPAPAPRAP